VNGSEAIIRTLVASGVDTFFTNPGTSEMHFVSALDRVPDARGILGLFEGVVTGAADGYGRMAGHPAATLLHLGPGLGNGLANLHNARRAHTPLVNVVGDHATYHRRFDAPLQSDIASIAAGVSTWIRDVDDLGSAPSTAADAVAAAQGPPGLGATLILPADVTWLDGAEPAPPATTGAAPTAESDAIERAAKALTSGEPAAILVGGRIVSNEAGLEAANQVAAAASAKLLAEVFPARMRRGAGIPAVERLGYLAEFAMAQLEGIRHLVLIDAAPPVSFFAYPDKPSDLMPDGCEVHVLASEDVDALGALDALRDRLAASNPATRQDASRPERPTGELTPETFGAAIGALLPEGAVVSDEGNTSGLFCSMMTAGSPAHDWLTLTGGAIGQGMPVATGAAVACPDRRVVNLQADGSALYTIQSLWTQAREGLDVTTVIVNNRSYAVLNMELHRVGVEAPGPKALDMLDLSRPDMDFTSIAEGLGVPATRATTADELVEQLERSLDEPGPSLIEAMVPTLG
jgi:acetolactate synthase-1/2/3 large subunit